VLLYLVSHGGIISQSSLLVHDVCRGVSEPQLFCVAVSAVVLLKNLLTMQTCPFAAQVEPTVFFFFRVASNLSLILSSFSSARVFCMFFLLSRFDPVALNLSTLFKIVIVFARGRQETFFRIYGIYFRIGVQRIHCRNA